MLIKQIRKHPRVYTGLLYLQEIVHAYFTFSKVGKPKVINMLANDICNSKCTMCNIWQQKLEKELSPAELEQILKDPLFEDVKTIGITGGEPTLREDLPELYQACCDAIPGLKGMSIITNAIKSDDVIDRIKAVNKVLSNNGKYFSAMVSLDGVGEVHDTHRGRPGNFETANEVVDYLRNETNIPFSIGCTVTKSNVYDVDELLDWIIEKGIYGRFRVGEFITRLYNNELIDEIRSFDEEETYHLACFFHRVQCTFETHPKYKRTYSSILSILNGKERTIGCPYQGEGVVLDSKGGLLYCAPKSKELGSTLEKSADAIYKDNKEELTRLKNENCSTCVHDYHATATKNEYNKILHKLKWQVMLKLGISKWTLPFISSKPYALATNKTNVFITGWYGTETVGDKAILQAIMDFYLDKFDQKVHFIVSAIHPFITERTKKELKFNADIVPYYSRDFVSAARSADITVMGGGPLMEMNALAIPLNAFRLAKKNGKKAVVFGCGIGPLYKKKFHNVVANILNLADEIKLRDSASIAFAKKLAPKKSFELFGDPAYHYVKRRGKELFKSEKKPIFACFLREWSREYARDVSEQEFTNLRHEFEYNQATMIKDFCREFNLTPHFYSMHTFHVGGDDRTFYRRYLKEHFSDFNYYLEKKPSTVDMVIKAMQRASYNLCMRFHSVLFAHTLETNFFAIDYTGGGKIKGFLTDKNKTDIMFSVPQIASKNKIVLQDYL